MNCHRLITVIVPMAALLADKDLVALPTLKQKVLLTFQLLASRPPQGWTSAQSLTFNKNNYNQV